MRHNVIKAIIVLTALFLLRLMGAWDWEIMLVIGIAAIAGSYFLLSSLGKWGRITATLMIAIVVTGFLWRVTYRPLALVREAMGLRSEQVIANTASALQPKTVGDSAMESQRLWMEKFLKRKLADSLIAIRTNVNNPGEIIARSEATKSYYDSLIASLWPSKRVRIQPVSYRPEVQDIEPQAPSSPPPVKIALSDVKHVVVGEDWQEVEKVAPLPSGVTFLPSDTVWAMNPDGQGRMFTPSDTTSLPPSMIFFLRSYRGKPVSVMLIGH